MRKIFYTICDTKLQQGLPNSRNLDFKGFMNSFKKFHPDIEMRVFSQHDLNEHGLDYLSAKPFLGLMLSKDYDLVVNVDADHYFFDRCEEILLGDYDIAAPANFNETDNLVSIKVSSGVTGNGNPNYIVSPIQFLQGGLIASPNKNFWAHYEFLTRTNYKKFVCFENDTLNLCAYLYPYNVKVLDGNCDYRQPEHKQWYGCSIINKESKCVIENDRLMCEGKPVKAYHFAHGGAKKNYKDIFPQSTYSFIQSIIQ